MEDRFIAQLRREMESIPELNRRLIRGIGDDAAILEQFRGNLTVTTDLLCDGVDFRIGVDSPRDIGHKALAVNLSDLAAMGATPLGVVISLLLPQKANFEVSEFTLEFYRGMIPLAKRFNVSMAGGDTNSGPAAFAVSVTAFGTVSPRQALLRSGAKSGDRILTTGPTGGSIFGRQFRFMPRVIEALFLTRYYKIHAAMDISDGLALDLSRLARESGVGFLLDEKSIPIHPDVLSPPADAKNYPGWETEKTPLHHALGDGEDFELILAVPPREAKRLLTDQPFVTMAKEARKPLLPSESNSFLTRIKSLCAEKDFLFSQSDFQSLSTVRLTDIGEFTPQCDGMNRCDARTGKIVPWTNQAGWSYSF